MGKPLNVLIIEDSEDDAFLLLRELKRNGYEVTSRRVQTAEALKQALDEAPWDVILSDYSMPSFSASDALTIVQNRGLDVPFIIVSGTAGEDIAVAAMKAGAHDFFAKDKMQRLGPAIERELRDVHERRERRLVETDLLLRNRAIEASPVGVMITDAGQPDNPIIYVNPAFEEITGYTAHEVLGRNARFLRNDDHEQPDLEELRAALRDQRECHVTLRNYRKDGRMFWNALRIAPIFDGHNRLMYFVGIQNDITARKVAEDELRSLYNATTILFRSTHLPDLGRQIAESVVREFNYVDCGVILVDEQRQRLIRLARAGEYSVHAALEQTTDGPGLVPLAVRTSEVVYAADVTRHPDYVVGIPETKSELVIPLNTSKGVIGVLDLQSTRFDAFSERDRRVLLVFAEHAATALEIVKLYEEVNQYAAELEWRVARRTAEFQRAKDQVETILNNVGDVIVLLDIRGHIMQANPAFDACYGYNRGEFLFEALANDILFVHSREVSDLIHEVIETGSTLRREFKCRHKTGKIFDVEAVFALTAATDGQDKQIVCSLRDITTQKKLEIELRQALEHEKELGELKARFIAMVSHEFRTPLAVMQSSTDILRNYYERMDHQKREEKLLNIQSQIKHLTGLIDDVLLLGRADAVGLTYYPDFINLATHCQTVVEEIKSIDRLRHEIRFGHSAGCERVFADDKLIGHILRNLLSNAIKYSPSGGAIEVNLECTLGQIVLMVADNGIGIPEKDQKRLFEMFHRADNVGTISGTGIGLAIVKHAVNTCGGTITFESREGAGTTFTVTLPVEKLDMPNIK